MLIQVSSFINLNYVGYFSFIHSTFWSKNFCGNRSYVTIDLFSKISLLSKKVFVILVVLSFFVNFCGNRSSVTIDFYKTKFFSIPFPNFLVVFPFHSKLVVTKEQSFVTTTFPFFPIEVCSAVESYYKVKVLQVIYLVGFCAILVYTYFCVNLFCHLLCIHLLLCCDI